MTNLEKIVPGCGNYNSFTGVCAIMFEKGSAKPTKAKEALIDPPGAIEGPPSRGVQGLMCAVSNNPKRQKDCNRFVARTTEDNLKDENI